jgi:hypothetical protein
MYFICVYYSVHLSFSFSISSLSLFRISFSSLFSQYLCCNFFLETSLQPTQNEVEAGSDVEATDSVQTESENKPATVIALELLDRMVIRVLIFLNLIL